MTGTCLYLLIWTYLTALSQCSPYTLTTPNLLRMEVDETIVVECRKTPGVIPVTIRVQDFPTKSTILFTKQVQLSSQNNPIAVKFQILPQQIPKSRFKQFVIVTATFPGIELHQEVLLLYETGHVFIQTDKPIYTPSQKVNYRLLTVDRDLKPNSKRATVEIMTPQGVVVQQDVINTAKRLSFPGISTGTFPIPELVQSGFWKIVAKYDADQANNYTTEFEVKEYVLPSFEVVIAPKKHFFYVADDKLDVEIQASYTYGELVDGRVFVLFAVMKGTEKLVITSSLQSHDIVDGRATASLTRQTITEKLGPIQELVGCLIHISASVITRTGSDMVEAENTDIKIVTSPYEMSFTKTPEYYKPGIPFDFMVSVTNPDGSPAKKVSLLASHGSTRSQSITGENGKARMIINTPGSSATIRLKVVTADPALTADRQAEISMTATAYKTMYGSKNYLHINPKVTDSDNLIVYLHVSKETSGQSNHITYILMNKGAIVKVGRQEKDPGQTVVTMSIPITSDLIPSFRIVAYYYMTVGARIEAVADSVWVDVKGTCVGSLRISAANPTDDKKIYRPSKPFNLKVTGDPGAKFGLMAVDKAVYVLNNKNRLTQSKIWKTVEKRDIGCTPGSGRDVYGVFRDAGLAFTSSLGFKTVTRSEIACPQPTQRNRRSLNLMWLKRDKEAEYSNDKKKCCRDGMKSIPMRYSCKFRSRRMRAKTECVKAFLDCCEAYQARKRANAEFSMSLARSDDDLDYRLYEDIFSRSNFKESWLWYLYDMPKQTDKNGLASKTIPGNLPDSITSWELQAISVSQDKGICVSESYELTVKLDFFIDLRLPYSAVRNEQVEIKAVLYNYHSERIKVRVEFPYNEHVCSGATREKRFRQTLFINAKSSEAVFYTIVPLTLGEVAIEVKASVYDMFVADGVRKTLRVVPEGVKVEKVKTIVLDPQGGEKQYSVDNSVPPDVVPNTEPQTFIDAQGDILTETIENSIDGSKLTHLIRQPTGCGEQNMASMTPGVIVTHYLDKSAQWDRVGLARRDTAIGYIRKGYAQQQVYRKPGGSYAAFVKRESSTWLTAYVAKVFAMAQSLIAIRAEDLCEDLKWLILRKQKPDGIFQEDAAVIHLEMQGGVRGAENDASLTAFVLIAMVEAKDTCARSIASYETSLTKASEYLEGRIGTLKRPYSVAITAYALSLTGVDKGDVLMRFCTDGSHWAEAGQSNSMYSTEATGYALLTLLQVAKYELTGKVVRWLSEKKGYGGGFGSTQATFVGLQALAKYQMEAPATKEVNMDVTLTIKGRQNPIPWHFDSGNVYVSKSEKINANQNFTVTVRGQGHGLLTVTTVYNALLTEKAKECKKFKLEIDVEEDIPGKRPQGALSSILINVCARNIEGNDVTMAIVDISMLTGFSPDIDDLKAISTGVDVYISKFELKEDSTHKSSLIIYLDSVSRDEDTCFAFKAHQYFKVGFMQPAAAQIYEYYDAPNSCTTFYNLEQGNAMLGKICHDDVCKCAAGNCVSVQKPNDASITTNTRLTQACLPEVDFVYKVRFLIKEIREGYDYFTFKVLKLIKSGSDEVLEGEDRFMVSHVSCCESFLVELNTKDYLIMGFQKDLWPMKQGITYVVTKGTWVEWWPQSDDCQLATYSDLCVSLVDFSDALQDYGCIT